MSTLVAESSTLTPIDTNLSEYLLNAEDCEMLTTLDYDYYFPNQEKMERFFLAHSKKYNRSMLNKADYPNVYITSDVHADIGKLVQLLLDLELIEFEIAFNIYTPQGRYSEELYTESLYGENLKWKGGSNAVFIIVGDLVDGRRRNLEIPDDKGTAELLLHVFLYNLRIKAIMAGSEVLFTIGNHDLTVFFELTYTDYSRTTLVFDKNRKKHYTNYKNSKFIEWIRSIEPTVPENQFIFYRKFLFNFYNCMNFLTAIAIFDNKKYSIPEPRNNDTNPYVDPAYDAIAATLFDVLCVHASIVRYTDHNKHKSFIDHILLIYLQYQFFVNTISGAETLLNDYDDKGLIKLLAISNEYLNDRTFSKESGSCAYLVDQVGLLVLGHCQTGYIEGFEQFKKIIDEDTDNEDTDKYKECTTNYLTDGPEKKSCVLIGCDHKLAFVDVAMSAAFQRHNRHIEILHLTLDDDSKEYTTNRKELRMVPTIIDQGPSTQPDSTAVKKTQFQRVIPKFENILKTKTNAELKTIYKDYNKTDQIIFLRYLRVNKVRLDGERRTLLHEDTNKKLHPLDIPYIEGNKSFRIADRAHATIERLRANLVFGGSRTKKQKRKKRTTYKKRPLSSTNVSTKRRHTHRT